MEFNKCSRCGCFFVTEGDVCPKCRTKDGNEFSTLKTYVQENGFNDSLDTIANQTGISVKNLNRFIGYEDFKNLKNNIENKNNINITLN